MTEVFSAPGKLMLLGEYVVLEGGTAMVAAVNRRATGRVTPDAPRPSPVVKAVVETAVGVGYDAPAGIVIDTEAFHDADGVKLGLGSSAAVAVLTAALTTGRGDDDTLRVAIDGHRAAAGGKGSGVDVAACFSGSVIATRRQPAPVDPLPSRMRGLTLSVLATGTAASTPDMVKRCQAGPRWSEWMAVLGPLATQGVEAWRSQDSLRWRTIVAKYGRAMKQMGDDAGVPVVTDQIDAVMRLAGEQQGAAKPSGAGGGDVVLVWHEDPSVAARIAEETGCQVVDLEIDPRGLSRKG